MFMSFKERGLPYAHILIILIKTEYKLRTADEIDQFVCVDIPDPVTERRLFDIVIINMMHGPCGPMILNSPCMANGEYTKHFPKRCTDETLFQNVDGYSTYHRPTNGKTALVRGHELGSEFVVPYNPYLLLKYNAHINVEVCSTVKSVMYL